MDDSQGSYQPNSHGISIDLFVSKKKPRNSTITTSNSSNLKFTDSSANLVFSVYPPISHFRHRRLTSPPFLKRVLADSSGNPLISIAQNQVTPLLSPDSTIATCNHWSLEHYIVCTL
ncbi:hypothetical protein LXL04_019635 [Taraxacum kok-saghyz]